MVGFLVPAGLLIWKTNPFPELWLPGLAAIGGCAFCYYFLAKNRIPAGWLSFPAGKRRWLRGGFLLCVFTCMIFVGLTLGNYTAKRLPRALPGPHHEPSMAETQRQNAIDAMAKYPCLSVLLTGFLLWPNFKRPRQVQPE